MRTPEESSEVPSAEAVATIEQVLTTLAQKVRAMSPADYARYCPTPDEIAAMERAVDLVGQGTSVDADPAVAHRVRAVRALRADLIELAHRNTVG